MEEGDEIQIGVINENSVNANGRIAERTEDAERTSNEDSGASDQINSKSSVDTVEKRKSSGLMPKSF